MKIKKGLHRAFFAITLFWIVGISVLSSKTIYTDFNDYVNLKNSDKQYIEQCINKGSPEAVCYEYIEKQNTKYIYETVENRNMRSIKESISITFGLILIPPILLYILGYTIAWVIRGFSNK